MQWPKYDEEKTVEDEIEIPIQVKGKLRSTIKISKDEDEELSEREKEVEEKIKKIMMTIPNIIDPSVPIGKDDSENVEVERFGEPVVPDFEIPYHTDIMESFDGIDLDLQKTVEDDSASGNNVNMLLAYKEMISQIANNAANFKSAGITRQQMENELDNAVEAVSNMKIVTGSANAEYEQELKDNLIESLGSARTIVNSTFNRENLATDTQGGEQNAADTAAD